MGLDGTNLPKAFTDKIVATRVMGNGDSKLPPGAGIIEKVVRNVRPSFVDGLNKTERRLLGYLKDFYKAQPNFDVVRPHAIRLNLSRCLRYTPDFYVSAWPRPHIYECKGPYIREDALVKFKAAVQLFPAFTFFLAQWKDQKWTITQY
jgi:hypothetical protein